VPIADVDLARHRWRSADTASLRGWSGAYPAFACNGYTDLLPRGSAAFLARQQARLPPSFADAAARGVQSPGLSPDDRHEAASGGFEQQSGDTTMAQIGTFTRDENGAYTGSIKTLTLNVRASIKPCDRDHDKAPDFRVTAGAVEFGAGWSKTARETGAEYLSLTLDDPSFTAPVYASLIQGDKGEHKLIWSR
jgi:uncharacterized protein (DUF736 family)